MRMNQRLTNEQGLTLIELTITIAVLGVIIIPLVASFTLALLETTSSRERTADATSAQLISTYLQNDIQSSCLRANPADPTTACVTGTVKAAASGATFTGTCAGVETKLELAWRDPGNPGADPVEGPEDIVVDYYIATTDDEQKELHRVECSTGADPADTLLALNLETAVFDATCSPTPDCTGAPETVSVLIKAESTRVEEKSSYEPFEFTFEATRRPGS
jgi:prepilin-type N-terminal cleavage/methylation domain-containing protein